MQRPDRNWQHFLNKLLRYNYRENAWEETSHIVRIQTNKQNIHWKLIIIKLIQDAMMSPALTLSRQWRTLEFYLRFIFHLQNYMEIDGRAIIKFRKEISELAFINKVESMRDITLELVIYCIEHCNCIIDDREPFFDSVREIAQPNEGLFLNLDQYNEIQIENNVDEQQYIQYFLEENYEVLNFCQNNLIIL